MRKRGIAMRAVVGLDEAIALGDEGFRQESKLMSSNRAPPDEPTCGIFDTSDKNRRRRVLFAYSFGRLLKPCPCRATGRSASFQPIRAGRWSLGPTEVGIWRRGL